MQEIQPSTELYAAQPEGPPVVTAACGCGGAAAGCGCGGAGRKPAFVYALGSIEARFPSLAVEKEFLQALARGETASRTDREVLHQVLSAEENRYLARLMCFVFSVEGINTYVLKANTDDVLAQLVAAIRPSSGVDRDVVIGVAGPLAPPSLCNGLEVPIVFCDRVYSFEVEELVQAIPRPRGFEEESFQATGRDLFLRVGQIADNAGHDDEHRALNYLVLRYPAIYAKAMEMYGADRSLRAIEVRPSRLGGSRKVLAVIFVFEDRKTGVTEKHFARVDVTEQWPFLVSPLSPFFDREV